MRVTGKTMSAVVAAMTATAMHAGPAFAQAMDGSCDARPTDSLGAIVKTVGQLPMDADALDGWMLVTAGPTGCAPVPVSLKKPAGAIARAKNMAGANGKVLFYVNGVANTPEIECEVLQGIAKATGRTVVGIYNGTDGIVDDLLEVSRDRGLIKSHAVQSIAFRAPGASENEAVRTMRAIVVSEVLAGRKPEIWAHSQGGAIVSLALFEANAALAGRGKDISGVSVTSFAAAAPAWPNGPGYTHYLNTGDLIPRYAGLGLGRVEWLERFRTGGGDGTEVIRFDAGRGIADSHDILTVYLPRWTKEQGR